MFLTTFGKNTNKSQAKEIFRKETNRITPTSFYLVSKILRKYLKLKGLHWVVSDAFSSSLLFRVLNKHSLKNAFPTLISFRVRDEKLNIFCRHMALVVGCTEDSIYLIDPLGKPPVDGIVHNVRIDFDQKGRYGKSKDIFYQIVKSGKVWTLTWRRNEDQ